MDSVRISIINHDLSTTTVAPVNPEYKGFTVVDAPKGPVKPVLISDLNELHNTFGYPSADYSELYEVEAFIGSGFPAYVSAPYSYEGSTIPVAYITKDSFCVGFDFVPTSAAFEKLVSGDNSVSVPGITYFEGNVPVLAPKASTFGKYTDKPAMYTLVDGILSSADKLEFRVCGFGKDNSLYFNVIADFTKTINRDTIGDESCGFKVVPSGSENYGCELFSNEAFIGYLTYVEGGKTLFVFKGTVSDHIWSQAKIEKYVADTSYSVSSLVLNEVKSIPSSDIHATVYTKNVENNGIFNVKISGHSAKIAVDNEVAKANRFRVSCGNASFEGSLDFEDRLQSGASLNFYDAQKEAGSAVGLYVVKPFVISNEQNDVEENNPIVLANEGGVPEVTLYGGVRASATSNDTGWKYALEEKYHDVNIFFDPAVHFANSLNSNTNFFKIANEEYHPLAGCIFNSVPLEEGKDYDTLEDLNKDLVTAPELAYGPNYWNICNVGKKAVNGKYVNVSMTGLRAASQMRILKDSFGGLAPMYTGAGELSYGVTSYTIDSLVYDFGKKAQTILNDKNYNAVLDGRTTNNNYGYMLASHKTCKGGELTDWSYIGHVAAFLQFEREIRDNVMFPQIGKANNEYYRSLRKYQAEEILRKRISGPNPIWAEGIVDTSTNPGVNDIAAQKARKFIINIRVKVNVFSEWVELNFTNVAQDMTV